MPATAWSSAPPVAAGEYPLYLIVLSVVQALVGDRAYALSPSKPLPILAGCAYAAVRPAL